MVRDALAEHERIRGKYGARLRERDALSTSAEVDPQRAEDEPPLHGAHRPHSPVYVWYVILLLFAVNVFNYVDRMALAVLSPSIKADLDLSDGGLGLLVGFAFFLFYALCGIPIARHADKGIRRNIIAVALATWSVMTALSGAAQNFWHLFIARVGVGSGEAGCIPPAQSLICDYVPPRRRSGVFAFHNFGLIAGMMVGMALAGQLGELIGWRWTFVALGVPGLGLAMLVRLTLREPARGHFDHEGSAGLSLRKTLSILWSCKTYRLLMTFSVVNGFVQYGVTQWWPSFYSRSFGLGMSSVGTYLGFAIGLGSAIGMLVGGMVANRVARRDVKLPLLISAASTTLALPTALGSLVAATISTSVVCVAMTAMFWSVSAGPSIAALYSVVTARMRATAGAMTIFVVAVFGYGLGPFCVGVLSDSLTPVFGMQGLRNALFVPVSLLPLAALALCMAATALPAELRRMNTESRALAAE